MFGDSPCDATVLGEAKPLYASCCCELILLCGCSSRDQLCLLVRRYLNGVLALQQQFRAPAPRHRQKQQSPSSAPAL